MQNSFTQTRFQSPRISGCFSGLQYLAVFRGPKLAHLAVQIFVQFRRSRVNARRNRASFCLCKNLSGPV